jgi:hypothetical protein
MVKSNFDDLGVFGQLEMRATTFILGVWGHVNEEVAEYLGFQQKSGSPDGAEIQTNGSRKNFPRDLIPFIVVH